VAQERRREPRVRRTRAKAKDARGESVDRRLHFLDDTKPPRSHAEGHRDKVQSNHDPSAPEEALKGRSQENIRRAATVPPPRCQSPYESRPAGAARARAEATNVRDEEELIKKKADEELRGRVVERPRTTPVLLPPRRARGGEEREAGIVTESPKLGSMNDVADERKPRRAGLTLRVRPLTMKCVAIIESAPRTRPLVHAVNSENTMKSGRTDPRMPRAAQAGTRIEPPPARAETEAADGTRERPYLP